MFRVKTEHGLKRDDVIEEMSSRVGRDPRRDFNLTRTPRFNSKNQGRDFVEAEGTIYLCMIVGPRSSTIRFCLSDEIIRDYDQDWRKTRCTTSQQPYYATIVAHQVMQKFEANSTEELIKYHTLYKLINNIEEDESAHCLGKLAEETGLVDNEDDEEAKEELDPVNPHYAPLRQAITKAYKSFNFAFDLGKSGLSGFSLQIRSADGLVDCGVVGNIKENVLKQHCAPAPYGDLATNTTKVDPEVRSALTIDYDKIVIKKRGTKQKSQKGEDVTQEDHYKEAVEDLLRRVQEEFQDDTLYFEPYKLNMYEKGGFFKAHKDTPRYSNMVGTMVVALEKSSGGNLIIRHGNESFIETGSATAFFCDREHEVTPVKYGTRVTLTFNICKDSESVAKTARAITLTRATQLIKDHNVASLIKAIKESPFKKIGILTEFDYTHKGITLQSLKGNDRMVLEELLKEPSFKIDLLPTVVSKHYTDNTGQDEYPIKYDIDGKVYRFATEDMDRMMRHEKAEEIAKQDLAVFFFHKTGLEVYKHEQQGAEHTGNESLEHSIDNIYFNAAIIVTDSNPKSTKADEKSNSGSMDDGSNESMDE